MENKYNYNIRLMRLIFIYILEATHVAEFKVIILWLYFSLSLPALVCP